MLASRQESVAIFKVSAKAGPYRGSRPQTAAISPSTCSPAEHHRQIGISVYATLIGVCTDRPVGVACSEKLHPNPVGLFFWLAVIGLKSN